MGKLLLVIICILTLYVGVSEAQVVSGTVNSRTLDGIGSKITSTVVGADRGLDINCIAGCGGGGGATEVTLLAFSNKFVTAYVDADAIVDQTTTAVHGQGYMFNGVTWDRIRGTIAGGLLVNVSNASLPVTGTFFQATQPVSGTFWQATQPVSVASLPLPTGAATEATVATLALDATVTNRLPAGSTPADNESNAITTSRLGTYTYIFDGAAWDRWTGAVTQGGTWNIGTVTTVTTVAALTSITNPVAVTGTFWQVTQPVSGTFWQVTQPVSGTVAVSNAFLLDATFTTRINTLGQKTMANSTPVVLPSDQAAIPVTVLSTVASANNDGACPSGAASFTVAASNASRTWLAMWASPANTDDVYVKFGGTATSSDARIAPGQSINVTSGRIYTGIVDALPASGTQAVCLLELN